MTIQLLFDIQRVVFAIIFILTGIYLILVISKEILYVLNQPCIEKIKDEGNRKTQKDTKRKSRKRKSVKSVHD